MKRPFFSSTPFHIGIAVLVAAVVFAGVANADKLPNLFDGVSQWNNSYSADYQAQRSYQLQSDAQAQRNTSEGDTNNNNQDTLQQDTSGLTDQNMDAQNNAGGVSSVEISGTVTSGTGGDGASSGDGTSGVGGVDPTPGGNGGGEGGGSGEGGGGTTLPEIIGDPDRVSTPNNPAAGNTGGGGAANADTMLSVTVTPKEGYEDVALRPVLYGVSLTNEILAQYYTVTADFEKADGTTYTEDVTSEVRFGTRTWQQEAAGGHTVGDEEDPVENHIAYVGLVYQKMGAICPLSASKANITFASYDHTVALDVPVDIQKPAETKTLWVNGDTVDLSESFAQVTNSLTAPDSQGFVHDSFRGWSDKQNATESVGLTYGLKNTLGTSVKLYSLGFASIPQDYLVRNIDGVLTLVGYTGSESAITVPEGVTRVALEEGYTNANVTSIDLGIGVTDIDFNNISTQWPNLAAYKATDSAVYEADDQGILYTILSKIDDELSLSLLRVPPCATQVEFSFEVIDLDRWAFADCSQDIHLTFKGDEPPMGGQDAIPQAATVTVMDADGDLTLKNYIAAWGDDGFALDSKTPAAYKYAYDAGTVVSTDGKTLEYIPRTYLGGYETPEAIESLGYGSLADAQQLTAVTLGSNVTKLDDYALAGLYGANALVVRNAAAIAEQEGFADLHLFPDAPYEYDPEDMPGVFTPGMRDDFMLYLPGVDESDATYAAWLAQLAVQYGDTAADHISCADVSFWSNPTDGTLYSIDEDGNYTLVRLPAGATHFDALPEGKTLVEVADGAFANCTAIKMIILPESCTKVATDAFDGCSLLEVVFSQNSTDAALRSLFIDDMPLSKLTLIDAGCTNIKMAGTDWDYDRVDEYVFYSKNNVGEATLEALVSDYQGDLTTIDNTVAVTDGACLGCVGLSTIDFMTAQDAPVYIGGYAFAGCAGLTQFPTTAISNLGTEAFSGCSGLGEIAINAAGLTTGESVFAGCDGVVKLTIDGSVGLFGDDAFADLERLADVTLDIVSVGGDEGTYALGVGMFKNCTALSHCTLETPATNKVTIGESAFQGCSNLLQLVVGGTTSSEALVGIDAHAFDGCTSFTGFSQYLWACSNIEYVDDYAFYNCPALSNLTIPDACTKIGDYAFAIDPDAELKDVAQTMGYVRDHPLCVASFGEGSYSGRTALSTAYLGSSSVPVSLGDGMFSGCSNLSNAELSNVTTIGSYVFYGCTHLTSLVFSGAEVIESIGAGAFAYCSSIASLSFQRDMFTTVGEGTFAGCSSMASITLPSTVTSIGAEALSNCSVLTSINLSTPDRVVSIDAAALEGTLTDALMTKVPSSAGSDVHALRDAYRADTNWAAIFGDNVNNIYDDAGVIDGDIYLNGGTYKINADGTYTLLSFDKNWTGDVSIDARTTAIADEAFKGCTNIMTVVINANVATVGSHVFMGCASLEAVAFNAVKAPMFSSDIFDEETKSSKNGNFRIYVPGGNSRYYYGSLTQLEDYTLISSGDLFSTMYKCIYTHYNDDTSTKVLSYMPRAFKGAMQLAPYADYIADSACEGCTGLTEFYSRSTLISIGSKAFKDCTSLTSANLCNSTQVGSTNNVNTNGSNALTNIGDYAFQGCTSLHETIAGAGDTVGFTIPQYVSSVGIGVFEGCTSLVKCAWYAFTALPNECFMNCTKFITLALGETSKTFITGYGDRAFMNCISLDPLTVGNMSTTGNLTYIGAECYKGTKIALVALPSSITRVGDGAFADCENLEAFAFNGSTCPTFDGSLMSDDTWNKVHVFVPSGTKDAYLAAWTANGIGSPAVIEATALHYRPIAGNIYAQNSDPSVGDKNMTLVASTQTTISITKAYIGLSNYGKAYGSSTASAANPNGVGIFAYRGTTSSYFVTTVAAEAFKGNEDLQVFISDRRMTAIGESAFENSALVAVDLARGTSNGTDQESVSTEQTLGAYAFRGCTDLEYVSLAAHTTSIGDGAFAGCSDDLLIDCARNMSTTVTDKDGVVSISPYVMTTPSTLGDHVFGDTLPADLRIATSADYTTLFVETWGAQLKSEYNIDNDRLAAIFGVDVAAIDETLGSADSINILSIEAGTVAADADAPSDVESNDSASSDSSVLEGTTPEEGVADSSSSSGSNASDAQEPDVDASPPKESSGAPSETIALPAAG